MAQASAAFAHIVVALLSLVHGSVGYMTAGSNRFTDQACNTDYTFEGFDA